MLYAHVMTVLAALILIVITVIVVLVRYPPMADGSTMYVRFRHKGGLGYRLLQTFVAPAVYVRRRNNVHLDIDIEDSGNLYTPPGVSFATMYLRNGNRRVSKPSWMVSLHNKLFGGSMYLKSIWNNKLSCLCPIQKRVSLLDMHRMVMPALQFKNDIKDRVDKIISPHIHLRIISVHFRSGDTICHYPFVKPNPLWFDREIRSVFCEGSVVLIATIDKEFRSFCSEHWKDIPHYFTGSTQLSTAGSGKWESWKNTNETSVERGTSLLVDMLVLSKANYLIKNRSCVSDMSLILNPKMGCSLIISDTEVYRKPEGVAAYGKKEKLIPEE